MNKQVRNELVWLLGLTAVALYATKNRKTAALSAFAGSVLFMQSPKTTSFKNQSVVITGGSRGLGFALAKELLREGAFVTILARDPVELQKAHMELVQLQRGRVNSVVCDVTDTPKLEAALRQAADTFDGIDLLINNAGSITVGPWETMQQEDFEAQMKLHVYAPMNAIRIALPFLRQPYSGKRIVNICSMGGRVAVPHMVPYDTSKFALAGFSQGVGAELASENISVTTIYPGLMRTGSPIQAVFKGNHEKEFAWFQTGDVFPFLSTSALESAQAIVEAARERRWELMPSTPAKVRMTLATFFPELMGAAMGWVSSLMPKGKSRVYKTGAQSRQLFDSSRLTKAFVERAHEAERELNQTPKSDPQFNMNLH